MDDFGTGYSSLSYLSRFPVDVLKMDRSFLREGASPEASGLASAVVALGETLRLDVVAEGIELPEQWTTLRDLGCELGQGFFFARPMDAERSRRCELPAARAAAAATAPQPMQHSHEGLDRPGGVQPRAACWHRCATATSACCGRRCASRCSATAHSWSRWRGRSTRCRTRPRRWRSSASR